MWNHNMCILLVFFSAFVLSNKLGGSKCLCLCCFIFFVPHPFFPLNAHYTSMYEFWLLWFAILRKQILPNHSVFCCHHNHCGWGTLFHWVTERTFIFLLSLFQEMWTAIENRLSDPQLNWRKSLFVKVRPFSITFRISKFNYSNKGHFFKICKFICIMNQISNFMAFHLDKRIINVLRTLNPNIRPHSHFHGALAHCQ